MPSSHNKCHSTASGGVAPVLSSQGSDDEDDSTYAATNDIVSDNSLEVTSHMSHSMKNLARMQKRTTKRMRRLKVKKDRQRIQVKLQ